MSLKSNVEFVKEALAKQGKDLETEINRVLNEGRQRTKASAVGYLMQQLEIERVQADLSGWWIGKLTDNFKNERWFVFEKETGKLHMIKNFEKDYKSFTPIKLSKIDRCKNTRTKAEWIEATDFTSAHLEDKLDITDLMNSLTPFDDINENDYYLITGTIKFVNQTPIFNPADPTKPSGVKPIIEPGQKGDLFHLRFVVSNVQNENINVSVGKFNHLINAYPEAPPNDFAKWFQNATDEDRLKEIQMALQGASIIALGRGSRYMDKDGVPTQLKKPFLYVAEDGIIVNVEQWQNNGGSSSQMKLEDSKTTQTPVQTSMPSLPSPTPAAAQPTSKITVGEIAEAVMKSIVAGKGGKEDLIGALPSQLGVDSQKIVEVIKDLSNRGEIYKEGSVYKSTSELP